MIVASVAVAQEGGAPTEPPADLPATPVVDPKDVAPVTPEPPAAVTEPTPVTTQELAAEPTTVTTPPTPATTPDVSAQAAANTTLSTLGATPSSPETAASEEASSPFLSDLLYGPVGAMVGNEAYRATFYELGFSYESAPWVGDGAVLSGVVFHENRGAIFNSFLAIAGAAATAASRQTHVYSHSDSNYDYYRGMNASEQAAENARIDSAMQSAADVASDRPLSMTAHLYSEDLGSSVNGGAMNIGIPWWIDAWSGGVVIEPAVSFAYAARHPDTEFNLRKGTLGWFGTELTVRIPILRFVGVVLHNVHGFTGDKPRILDVGVEGTIGNRFVLRGSWNQSSIAGRSAFSQGGLRFELAVRL